MKNRLSAFIIILFWASYLQAQLKVHPGADNPGAVSLGTLTAPFPGHRVFIRATGTKTALRLDAMHSQDWMQSMSVQVNREKSVSYVVRYLGSDRFWVDGLGRIWARSAVYYSDARLKTSISDIVSPLERVLRLRGRRFRFLSEPVVEGGDSLAVPPWRYGFIAQEVVEYEPDLVTTIGDSVFGVDYGQVNALLVEAVKEQQAAIEARGKEIAQLRSDLEELRKVLPKRAIRRLR